ncbi:MAG: acyl-CoA dehydrogenase family protein [Acidimicrobiales bacterium]
MRFAFTDDQILFRDTVRDLLDKECQPEQVRYAWVNDDGRLPELWSALAEMGVLGMQVPDAFGGLGMTELDLVLLLEETGRVGLPDPIVESVAVAAPLLAESAPASFQEQWLPGVAAGETIVTTTFGGALVPAADSAALVLAEQDGRLVAVPRAAAHLERQVSVDGSRRLFEVTWDDGRAVVLAEGDDARAAIDRAFDRGALGTASQLLGLGRQMLDLTVGYVKERHQFGVPIGSFQAVKHHLADALLRLEFAVPVVHAAAYAMATGDPDAPLAVSHAKAAANDAARLVCRQALQCHGAIGYTVEYDLHLWLKRVWALSESYGNSARHRRRVADRVLGPIPSQNR